MALPHWNEALEDALALFAAKKYLAFPRALVQVIADCKQWRYLTLVSGCMACNICNFSRLCISVVLDRPCWLAFRFILNADYFEMLMTA